MKADIFKVDAAVRNDPDSVLRGGKLHLLLQHLTDAACGGQRPGQQQKDVGNHHHRVHDLKDIAQKAGQVAHLQLGGEHHVAAEPHDQHHRHIHGQLKGREIEHRVVKGGLAGVHQQGVDLLEFFHLILAADKRLHRADGGQALLHDVVELIHRALQDGVHRRDLAQDEKENHTQHRRADQKDHRQLRVHPEREPHAHNQHHRAAHHRAETAVDGVLQCLADAGAPAIGGAGGKARVQKPGDQRKQGAKPHLHALV